MFLKTWIFSKGTVTTSAFKSPFLGALHFNTFVATCSLLKCRAGKNLWRSGRIVKQQADTWKFETCCLLPWLRLTPRVVFVLFLQTTELLGHHHLCWRQLLQFSANSKMYTSRDLVPHVIFHTFPFISVPSLWSLSPSSPSQLSPYSYSSAPSS